MHIGVYMFPTDYAIRVDELAEEAERRGFESLWVPEHTHIPTSRKSPFPGGGELPREYSHTLDPFVGLAAAAARTHQIRIATGICLLIQRDTIVTAKEVASLDQLSGGRFLFGIGGGWNREEMEHHGTDYESRFQRLEEQVEALKKIWTEDEAEFHGEHIAFDKIWSWPKPFQKPYPPIILGGHTRHTRQRVVDHCDGWLPIGFSTEAVLRGIEDLRERAEKAERDIGTISVSVFGARPDRETLDSYEAAGVERVIFALPPAGRDKVLPKLDDLAQHLES
jgi:probable F420-dependent oxidoreductase